MRVKAVERQGGRDVRDLVTHRARAAVVVEGHGVIGRAVVAVKLSATLVPLTQALSDWQITSDIEDTVSPATPPSISRCTQDHRRAHQNYKLCPRHT